jgi:NAD(P)-dependent dehydrogenase (short-subunit alcohol dehydrogenase family)
MPTALVIGASRGIGLEFVRQYAADGWDMTSTCRSADAPAELRATGARTLRLDVTDVAAVQSFGTALDPRPLDLALYVAGIYGPRTSALEPPGAADFDAVMHTNVRAPMMLIPQLADRLAAARGKLVVMSSRMGSTGLMAGPSGWLYRASKAALNNVLRAASLELGPRGVVCFAFHPGWVRTAMGGTGATLEVDDSVGKMRHVIAAANDSHNGKFLNFTGEQLSW